MRLLPSQPGRYRPGAVVVLWALVAWACDGTLSGMHTTRGVLPVVYSEPMPSSTRQEGPAMIRAQHMLIMHRESRNAPPTVVRSKPEALARAEEALLRIQEGADVNDVFALYSEEPGASQREPPGDLGQFARKGMVKRFADAAFRLKVGEVSAIVETEFGFHLIRRLE